jgi:hypothetical protein
LRIPANILDAISPAASQWLRSLAAANPGGLRDPILVAWDRLLAALPHWADAHDQDTSSDERLLDESVNHPAGDLAAILITLQDGSPKEPAAGLAPDLRPQFEELTALGGRVQKLALAQLARVLPFFLWLIGPKRNFARNSTAIRSNGRQLLSTLILYGQDHYYHVQIFNRLKPMICAALLDPETGHDVRDRIAQFIPCAAIGLKMGGNPDVSRTEPEAR